MLLKKSQQTDGIAKEPTTIFSFLRDTMRKEFFTLRKADNNLVVEASSLKGEKSATRTLVHIYTLCVSCKHEDVRSPT